MLYLHFYFENVIFIMSLYPRRDTYINLIFILQLKTGLRKTSARKNGNATPLRNGK